MKIKTIALIISTSTLGLITSCQESHQSQAESKSESKLEQLKEDFEENTQLLVAHNKVLTPINKRILAMSLNTYAVDPTESERRELERLRDRSSENKVRYDELHVQRVVLITKIKKIEPEFSEK